MAPDLSFGPAGEQWHYSRATKTYDLTRGTTGGFTLATSQGVPDTYLTVAPSLSALVVVDMQNFFLHPSCRDHPPGLAAVEPTVKVVEKCRELGIQARQSLSLSPLPFPTPGSLSGHPPTGLLPISMRSQLEGKRAEGVDEQKQKLTTPRR